MSRGLLQVRLYPREQRGGCQIGMATKQRGEVETKLQWSKGV